MIEMLVYSGVSLGLSALGISAVWGRLQQKVDATEKKVEPLTDMNVKLERMSVALWGIDGSNGLRGEVREVKEQLKEINEKLDRLMER